MRDVPYATGWMKSGRDRYRVVLIEWLRAGAPGLDSESAVACGPAAVPGAIADALEAGALEAWAKKPRVCSQRVGGA